MIATILTGMFYVTVFLAVVLTVFFLGVMIKEGF